MFKTRARCWVVFALLAQPLLGAAQSVEQVRSGFVTPPDDARVMMRWWWFGPAVSEPELKREISAMKAGGYGGFEIQPMYPQSLDDPNIGLRNLTYRSDDFIGALRFAAKEGVAQGMRVDVTLGSGWPFGGPHIPVTQAASQILMTKAPLAANETSVATPRVGAGEKLLGVFIGDGGAESIQTATLEALPLTTAPRVQVEATTGERSVLFFMQSRTGQQVKRPGIGGEGFVLDHMSRVASDGHLSVVGDRLMQAFGDRPPTAVFSDNLEVYKADWTDDLPQEFQRRRGYDLLPLLPSLFFETGPEAADVRHDWGQTLSELVDERYLKPSNAWARAHRTQFRSQTYGFPPVTLSSNALVALPEGEGNNWRAFTTTRWATSASHLFDRNVTSAEAWTWLHSPSFRATPLDMKAEADILFLQGINQLIGHGWPYTPPGVAEPGWSLYAAAVFSDQNPWWLVMPDISRYLQRVSYVLRQGRPANDIAILMPTNDAWAATKPGRATVSDEMHNYVTAALTTQLLDAGYGFDYIDSGSLDKLQGRYRVLLLPKVTRIDPTTYKKIEQFVRRGGSVLAVDQQPSLGAGRRNAAAQAEQVQALTKKLFRPSSRARVISEATVGEELRKVLEPDLQLERDPSAVGFIHRRLEQGDVYFVANTTNKDVSTRARFRDGANKPAQLWNPVTGVATAVSGNEFDLKLAPYESVIVVFGAGAAPMPAGTTRTIVADVSGDWQIEFSPLKVQRAMKTLASWTEDAATRYYSGVASYKRNLEVKSVGSRYFLNFGAGTPVPFNDKQRGSRAWLESPVREAAEVFVNGERVGSVWTPPYEIEITPKLKAGANELEVRVGNLAINTLAGRTPPDYRLLNLRYGERFQPQDMENLQPLPAGLIGTSPITVLTELPSH